MTITKEGALASFYTVNKAPIKHLKVYFSPKQAGSGDASPENIRPIEGWNNINLLYSGKNLVKNANITRTTNGVTFTVNTDGSVRVQGTATDTTWWSYTGLPVTYLKAGTYRLTGGQSYVPIYLVGTDDDGTQWSEARIGGTEQGQGRTFTLTQGATVRYQAVVVKGRIVDTTIYPMLTRIEDNSIFTSYSGIDNIINFPETIYGGYIDLITGELVQEQIGQTFKGSDVDQVTELTNTNKFRFRFYKALKGNGATKAGITYCDRLQYQYHEGDSLHYYFTANNSNGNAYVYLPKDFGDNDEVTIIASLYTPELVATLTPTELKTFIGYNNIWSNADRVEVEYGLAESNDELYRRRNIILQGAPHLETTTNNIANFNTDIIAPIKDAKIYFNPVQEGSGNPSPENIRAINGFDKINLQHTSKNLLDPSLGKRYSATVPEKVWGVDSFADRDIPNGSLVLQPGIYTLSIGITSGNTPVEWRVKNTTGYIDHAYSGHLMRTFTITKAEPILIYIATKSGDNSFLDTSVMLEQNSPNDIIYEQYNGQTIPIIFPVVGKNLLDVTDYSFKYSSISVENGILDCSNVASGNSTHIKFTQEFGPGTYTISLKGKGTGYGGARLLCSTNIVSSTWNDYYNSYWINITDYNQYSGSLTFTLNTISTLGLVFLNKYGTTNEGAVIYDIQLELNSIATIYESYDTACGGYIDLINGEIIQTYKSIIFNGTESGWNTYGAIERNDFCAVRSIDDKAIGNQTSICNILTNIDGCYAPYCYMGGYYCDHVNNKNIYICMPNENITTLEAFKTWLNNNPMQLVYKLADPIHYSIPSQTLKTLKGTNNIWSNANGPVSITYWTH